MDIFSCQLHKIVNPLFARRSVFPSLESWSVWSRSYGWIDEVEDLLEGDTIAFAERLDRSPYPSLVIATVALVEEERCDLAIISHDNNDKVTPSTIISRPLSKLLAAEVKRWPRTGETAIGHILPGNRPPGVHR